MSYLWTDKYRPETFDQLVIPNYKLQKIKDWFLAFNQRKSETKALLFTGPPGLGKTSLAHIILRQFGYNVAEFNASDIRAQSLVNENLYDLICMNKVNDDELIGIIMDEVDGMATGDRGGLEELLSFIQPPNRKKRAPKRTAKTGVQPSEEGDETGKKTKLYQRSDVWGPPVICICNTGNVKQNTLTLLRSHCTEISFQKPTIEELKIVLQRVIVGESLTIAEDAQLEILKFAAGDYRRLVTLLQHLNLVYGNRLTLEHVNDGCEIFARKEQDLHVNDNIKRLLNESLPYQEVMNIYHRDKSKTPMVMHQNYIDAIDAQKTSSLTDKTHNALAIIESLVVSDIIEKNMYNNQSWYLQPMQGISCCVIPNYYLNTVKKSRVVDASWTDVLGTRLHTRTSQKKIQEVLANIDAVQSYTSSDIQLLSELIVHLFLTDEKKALKTLEHYGLMENGIVDTMAQIIKLNESAGTWKGKKTGEKTRIERMISTHSTHSTPKTTPGTSTTPAPVGKKIVIHKKTSVPPVTPIPSAPSAPPPPKRKLVSIKLKTQNPKIP